ncbi:putative Transcriptional regulator [[Clostridium] ultunense Esp]|uniref:Putative Transcriptional regulator n=2 Tax=Schnuerera ultunensis TaxID=45497 RepID=A0A1M4PRZ2_9FIRM|nr:putative Transcriptional regulator [[Clostridium] ultunense Esp]
MMKKKFWVTFLIALVGFSALFATTGHYILNKDSIANQWEEDDLEAEKILKDKGEILFLLMGIDDQDGTGGVAKVKEKKIEGEDRHKPTGKRTDTMILCKYNFETGDITMLSIPRDSRVNIRGRKEKEKITHAHSYGGPYLAMKTVKDFLNINLEYYVTVDYLAVREIVDAIGGVKIDIPKRMYYSDPTDKPPLLIDFQPGLQTLDGDDSIRFLRYRPKKEGDLGRVENQKLFMKEFIKQTLKPKNITRLPKMIKTYYDYVDTNIPMNVILKGIGTANKIDLENMKTAIIPGVGEYIGGISYFIYDEEGTKQIIEEMFENFLLDK